jgi:hypothetical protein
VLARLSKTLSTNVAIAGLTAVVLGAGGTTATLAAGDDDNPGVTQEHDDADEDADEADEADSDDADEQKPDADAEDTGVRPTDTHGYCVSQVAQAPLPEGSTVNHGSLVSAAAHACGKDAASQGTTKSAEKKAAAAARAAKGKAHAHHATGKPTG